MGKLTDYVRKMAESDRVIRWCRLVDIAEATDDHEERLRRLECPKREDDTLEGCRRLIRYEQERADEAERGLRAVEKVSDQRYDKLMRIKKALNRCTVSGWGGSELWDILKEIL